MNLLDECIDLLSPHVEVLNEVDSDFIFEYMEMVIPFHSSGRVDWREMTNNKILYHRLGRVDWREIASKKLILSLNELGNIIKYDSTVYVCWDDANLPVLSCKLKILVENLYDVTCFSFDTWLFNPEEEWIIEFYHEGEVVFGKI